MSTQFHILVVGFELEKKNREGGSHKTDLRHYRYDTSTYTLTNENNAVMIREGKSFVAQFPTANTMVLLEDKIEDQ